MNINNAILEAKDLFIKNNIKTPQLDSEILMSLTIKKTREKIILESNRILSQEKYLLFQDYVKQRLKGKPIAYLTGKKEFWKYEFLVSKDVLIPRPDTELIIDQVLSLTKYKNRLQVLDIGVGSGCILLSILKEKKNFHGIGIDVCKKSLDICKINTLNLKIKNRVKFFKSDIDNFNYGKYDLIISNPPYIKKNNIRYLDKEIVKFEPKKALDGGLEGLSEISKVINKSSELIKKNGNLVLEISYDQKNKVVKLLKDKGFYINKVIKDYAQNDRCVVSTKY